MRGLIGHTNDESFVVVGRTSNNIEDGVSLRKRQKRHDTFDINLRVHAMVMTSDVLPFSVREI